MGSAARCAVVVCLVLVAFGYVGAYAADRSSFRFVILGDRTGEAVAGVYREAWREAAEDKPDFVLTVGDTIEGGNDATVNDEWKRALARVATYRHVPTFFTPGNHDVWSAASATAYARYTKHPLHYGFDYRDAHFTILDNSRSDLLSDEEMRFLQADLEAHKQQRLKFIVSHRPSWLLQAVLRNSHFPLSELAQQYGVRYVIAGHVHQMLHFEVGGITYLSMPSSGGHLRASKKYEDGWFFAYSLVTVNGSAVDFKIKELRPPYGKGRVTKPKNWGGAGLLRRDY